MVTWLVDELDSASWNEKLKGFSYFSLYHSYEWGEVKRNDGWNVVRIISSDFSSLAQILYKRLPGGFLFFWSPGGIIGQSRDIDLNQLKSKLKHSFSYFRSSFQDPSISVNDLIKSGWKKPNILISNNLSMKLDLTPANDELTSNMSSNWRHNLKRFEKRNIKVLKWDDPDGDIIFNYYKEFESMKGLAIQHSLQSLKSMMKEFGDKVVIYRAFDELGNLLALRGYIHLGHRALDMFAISTKEGRTTYSSYGVLWELLKDAKTRGITHYDLSGVDPEKNEGVYNFKKGAGGILIEAPGEFEKASFPGISLLMNHMIKVKFRS